MTDVQLDTPRPPTEDEKVVELLRKSPGYIGHGKIYEFVRPADKLRLMYPTDRLSARDFVLPYPVPDKGLSATAMTVCAKKYLRSRGVRTDLVAYGCVVDDHLSPGLRGKRLIQERGMIVREYDMVPYEIIIRGYVLGSMATALERAAEAGEKRIDFCGFDLPTTLRRGRVLPQPLVTPTTKAASGHDQPVRFQDVEREYPGICEFGERVFTLLADRLKEHRKGRLLDMKIEVAFDRESGEFVLCDEISPDSCRFCLEEDVPALLAGLPFPSYDKEFFRQYVDSLGMGSLDPEKEEDRAVVASWTPDPGILKELARRQRVACELMCGGLSPDEYARNVCRR